MSLLSWFGVPDNQAAGDAADAQNQVINEQLLAQGSITQAQYDQTQQDMSQGNADTGTASPTLSILGQAAEGATEIFYDPSQWWADTKSGAQTVAQAAATAAGYATATTSQYAWALVKQILKSIPWWVWLALALGLFLWMGGLALLKGRLKK